ENPPRVMTMLRRPVSDRPMDWKVLRPIRMGLPNVLRLKCARSAGRCQGSALSRPITSLSDAANAADSSEGTSAPGGPAARRLGLRLRLRPGGLLLRLHPRLRLAGLRLRAR